MSGGSADIRVGDIVSRCGDDRFRVTGTNGTETLEPDLIDAVCLMGSQYADWQPGETDFFCADDIELIERSAA